MKRIRRVYISGPVTGVENNNLEAFMQAQERFQKNGWAVINPLSLCGALDKEWEEYMRADIQLVAMLADAIALLPGWKKSTGARGELFVAKLLKLPIYNAKTMTLMPLDLHLSVSGSPEADLYL